MLPGPNEARGGCHSPPPQAKGRACADLSYPGKEAPLDSPLAGQGASSATEPDQFMARLVIMRADGSYDVAWLVGPGPPDISTVDTLARLQLVCRRGGDRVRLEGVSEALAGLLELSGLRAQFEWEPELREEPLGLEEGVDAGDPVP
jgi:hypothetical protein